MKIQISLILVAMALSSALSPEAVAQGQQFWQQAQQNQINQDFNSGMINPNQAANLDAREAQIQSQQQIYRAQNGYNNFQQNGGYQRHRRSQQSQGIFGGLLSRF